MKISPGSQPLLVLVGPTAVGKTETAIRLAERLGAEIVSADSRYFYRGMDIGTAKPTPEERARAPHHLIDVAEPDQTWSLTIFQAAAQAAIAKIHARGRLPILVGGTGQYVKAVVEGWDVPPQEPDPRLRAAIERWAAEIGGAALHRRLAVLDPDAAAVIDFHNVRRTVRALEVIFGSGQRFSAQRRKVESPYRTLVLGLARPRPELYARVDERIEAMFAGGLVAEVRGLLAKGYAPALPSMSAIGYREVVLYLRGRATLDEAKMIMKRQTRVFVRRQGMWFRADDPGIHWFAAGDADVLARIEAAARAWIAADG